MPIGKRSTLGLMLIGLVLSALGCSSNSSDQIPIELVGIWTTPHPLFKGRFMELTPDRVTFGTGDAGPSTHAVKLVRWEAKGGEITYRIVYLSTDGEEYTLSVRWDPRRQELRLVHRDAPVWGRRLRAATVRGRSEGAT